ncbi:uncharacterized protein LOC114642733 isoform X1 [Erpetoichthys calabaricus]|uniref:uncharacterized protein LOC114642733 isoform X1 n=1 Tax=Erpetoichthys calabaricus TaxID=27687 RepID=UPI0022346B25|nr:uncharacterized protein LOC114642733 isoform X1 [Erpetoichthys calabaricus]
MQQNGGGGDGVKENEDSLANRKKGSRTTVSFSADESPALTFLTSIKDSVVFPHWKENQMVKLYSSAQFHLNRTSFLRSVKLSFCLSHQKLHSGHKYPKWYLSVDWSNKSRAASNA